jgi:hypothetical protein
VSCLAAWYNANAYSAWGFAPPKAYASAKPSRASLSGRVSTARTSRHSRDVVTRSDDHGKETRETRRIARGEAVPTAGFANANAERLGTRNASRKSWLVLQSPPSLPYKADFARACRDFSLQETLLPNSGYRIADRVNNTEQGALTRT